MEALILGNRNCNLRRIDIRQWGSEVAKQYGVRELPTVWLYKGEKRVETDRRKVLKRLTKLD